MKLYFDFRDVFRAARYGFSGKKILLQFWGFLLGYVGYLILTYIALLVSSIGLGATWATYRLFPAVVPGVLSWLGWIIYIAGIVFWIIMWLLYSTATAKITYQQLKGDDFYTARESIEFIKKNWKAIIFSPIMVIIIMAFLVICGIIAGLIGKIPFLGELLVAIFTIPIWGAALFLVFLGVVFCVGIIMGPAIVATAREDSFETMIQFFSSIWSQTWRFVIYNILLGGLVVAAVYIFGLFSYWALKMGYMIMGWTMGPKLHNISLAAINWLPTRLSLWSLWGKGWWAGKLALISVYRMPFMELHGAESAAAVILGIFLLFIFGLVLSYGMATWSAGQTIIYLIIRKRKDDENLLEREDEEEELEEFEEAQVEEEKTEPTPAAEEKKEEAPPEEKKPEKPEESKPQPEEGKPKEEKPKDEGEKTA
jgi:hypothetical protein